MKISRIHFFIYLFVTLFLVSLSSPITINLQFGVNSSYNEIEHAETIPFTELNEEIKHKVKLCQDLFQLELFGEKSSSKAYLHRFNDLKDQINLSILTPPPKFV